MAIKLIVLDLDGTTLKNKWQIHPDNLKIIKRVHDEKPDVKVVIATGRGLKSTINYAKALEINENSQHIICYNGGSVIDISNNKEETIFQQFLSSDQAKKLFEFAQENNLKFWGYGTDNETAYINKHSLKVWLIEKFNKVKIIKVTNIEQIQPLYKVLLFYKKKEYLDGILKQLNNFGDFELSSSFHNVIEVNPLNVNKCNGVKVLTKKWNIDPSEVLACGDGMNDYKLIKWAKYGIAMENSHPNLKEIAFDITDKNTNGGVAQAIEKYIFPKQELTIEE